MTKEAFCAVFGDISEDYVEKARTDRKAQRSGRMEWCAAVACLCLAAAGAFLLYARRPADFHSMMNQSPVDTTAIMTLLPVDGWTACYQQVDLPGSRLQRYMGTEYLKADSVTWYFPEGISNLNYLIRKDQDGALTLWRFTSFAVEGDATYTYGDVLSVICGADGADDIVGITTSPFQGDNTPEGRAIQKEIGTHTYTDRETITAFYGIVRDVVCYGADRENPADDTRFSYSFSTGNSDGPTSEESTYGTRCISVTLKDGTVLDSWKYSALSGSFFEYGGIFTQPLEDDDVFALNDMFVIR